MRAAVSSNAFISTCLAYSPNSFDFDLKFSQLHLKDGIQS